MVAQVVKRLFGHVKRAPVEGPSPFLSKDNTLTSEMQIALFSPLPPKASSGEGEFSTGLPEDAAGEEGVPCTLHERFGRFHVCRLERMVIF